MSVFFSTYTPYIKCHANPTHRGITSCSTPRRFFWFNPVQVLLSELLAGSTISIPTQVTKMLNLLRLAQQLMFGLFLAAIVLATILLVGATPLVSRSRLWSIPAGAMALAAAASVTVATVLATIMSIGAKIALTSVDALNIRAEIGTPMFAFMWIATICIDTAAIFHVAMACFCAPYRENVIENENEPLPAVSDPMAEEVRSWTASGTPSLVTPKSSLYAEDEIIYRPGAPAGGRFTRLSRIPAFFIKRRRKNEAHMSTAW